MANTYTTNLNLAKPAQGDLNWNTTWNQNLDDLDSIIGNEHNADGSHNITTLSLQEQSSNPPTPSSGYHTIFARDGGYVADIDDAGNIHALAWVDNDVKIISFPKTIALVKAGPFTDSDSDADGFIGIDKTNGRIYYRHSGGTWQYIASLVTQTEMNLTTAASVSGEATRYDEFIIEHNANGTHNISNLNLTNLDEQEQSSDPSAPSSGNRRLFARDGGYWAEEDDGGNVHALAWSGGEVKQINIEPSPSMWQHSASGVGSNYGSLRIEIGNDTLSAGTSVVTFQQAFTTILEVFLQDKTAANAIYPSAISTTGFTANGTTTDAFAWMAIGAD